MNRADKIIRGWNLPTIKKIAAAVKREREEKKWTQQELSYETRLPISTISGVENSHRWPNTRTLYKVCKACGITLSELFEGID